MLQLQETAQLLSGLCLFCSLSGQKWRAGLWATETQGGRWGGGSECGPGPRAWVGEEPGLWLTCLC